MDYAGVFVVLNAVLTLALMGLGLEIFIYFRKANMELLKARMFLKRGLVMNMWLYSVASGGWFVTHGIASFLVYYGLVDNIIPRSDIQNLILAATLTCFLVPFLMLTYNWRGLIKQSVK